MADLNLSPVKETAEASVILKPTWLQEVRPYVSLASEVLSPQPARAVPAAGSLQGWLRTAWEAFSKLCHISRVVVFYKKGSSLRGILSGLGFMRNASLRGSFSQALTIFQRAHRKTAQQNSPRDFFLALLFLHRHLTDHCSVSVKWLRRASISCEQFVLAQSWLSLA